METARTSSHTTPAPANRSGIVVSVRQVNGPETYMLDGHQYILATGGDQLFAFRLNQ